MTEPKETEVKLRLESPGAMRERLARLGARLARARHFEDNVLYDDPAGSLAGAGAVLRLRRTPHASTLTFKGPRELRGGIKTREERESLVESAEAVDAILEHLGYRPVFRYQKYRESWSYRGQQVEVDETPIGAFLEIEGDAAGIAAVASELGYAASDFLAESYVGLFRKGGGRADMVFPS